MIATWIAYMFSDQEARVSAPECLNALQTSTKANITSANEHFQSSYVMFDRVFLLLSKSSPNVHKC